MSRGGGPSLRASARVLLPLVLRPRIRRGRLHAWAARRLAGVFPVQLFVTFAASRDDSLGFFQWLRQWKMYIFFDQFQFSRALETAWALVAAVDKYIVENEPWALGEKQDEDAGQYCSRGFARHWCARGPQGCRFGTIYRTSKLTQTALNCWRSADNLHDRATDQPAAVRCGAHEDLF